jgi:hypothetical protein
MLLLQILDWHRTFPHDQMHQTCEYGHRWGCLHLAAFAAIRNKHNQVTYLQDGTLVLFLLLPFPSSPCLPKEQSDDHDRCQFGIDQLSQLSVLDTLNSRRNHPSQHAHHLPVSSNSQTTPLCTGCLCKGCDEFFQEPGVSWTWKEVHLTGMVCADLQWPELTRKQDVDSQKLLN